MHIKRASSLNGHPPPGRPVSAVVLGAGGPAHTTGSQTRAASASAVTFKMKLCFNLSRPVLSAQLQLKPASREAAALGGRQPRGGAGSRRSSGSSGAGRGISPGTHPPGLSLAMSVTEGQAQRTLTLKRSARAQRDQAVGRAARASIAQREHNKQRFENALVQADDGGSVGDWSGGQSPPGPPSISNVQGPSSASLSVNSVAASSSHPVSNNSHRPSLPSIADSAGTADQHQRYYFRSSSCSIRSRHNGPTVVGSPLYNKKQGQPESDAPRPVTCSGSGAVGYNHERYRTCSPALRQHMVRVSSAFRVVAGSRCRPPPPAASRCPGDTGLPQHPSFAHLLLVSAADPDPDPVAAEAENFIPEKYFRDQPNRPAVTSGEDLVKSQPPEGAGHVVVAGTDSIGKPGGIRLGGQLFSGTILKGDTPQLREQREETKAQGWHNEKAAGCTQTAQYWTSGVPGREAPSPMSMTGKVTPPERTRADRQTTTPPNQVPVGNEQQESGHSSSGSSPPSSDPPSRPSSAKYWQTRTWVDDATVSGSSDQVVSGEAAAPAPAPSPEPSPPTRPPAKSQPNKPEARSPGKPKADPARKSPPRKATGAEKPEGEPAGEAGTVEAQGQCALKAVKAAVKPLVVMNLNDLKRKRQSLPDFICPSSEEKSRESAVVDWLETTSLHWAMKTAPLL